MTTAPECLKAPRRLLLEHLDMHPGQTVDADLDPAEVGIVGDPNHAGGYHCGEDRVRRVNGEIRDYSVIESSRDRDGLTDDACALDVGWFRVTTRKGTFDLRHYSRWLVAQCEANTPDTRDIREVIYSPDGQVVKRWDRLGKRTTGDLSHLTHTHKSYFRDAIKAGRDQSPVIRRYLIEIGLLEDDMTEADFRTWFGRAVIFAAFPERAPDAAARQLGQQTRDAIRAIVAPEGTSAEELAAALDARPVADVDEAALAAQLAPLLQPGVTLEQLLAVFNSARLTTGAG